MGHPTGFLEHEREGVPWQEPLVRLRGWTEFAGTTGEDRLRRQGARCMDCGVPFCQSEPGCPVDNLIPEWNDLVYHGRWREALDRLHRTNPFPEFTGRVCPAPCEGACVLGITHTPVAIKSIENAIIERGFDEGWVTPRPPARRSGRAVAIVGSGPAGLAAAHELNRQGHRVTVYERDDRVGGLLTYGIPNMKLDKSQVVDRRVDLLRREGIRFETGVEVGVDLGTDELRRDHDALLLCTGATRPRDLALPGRELAGIHFAMPYLTAATKALLAGQPATARPNARGRRVLVIGGGDTGTDCVATATRQGAASVTNLELLERPPDDRASDNPWPQWPRIFRTDYGHQEAAARYGHDPRRFAVLTKRFLDDGAGRVRGVETVDVRWSPVESGPPFEEVAGTEQTIETDLVLLALGFLGPEPALPGELGVALDDRGNVAASTKRWRTSVDGVFAAGDCRRGQSLVVWAIHEGLEAAAAAHDFLES